MRPYLATPLAIHPDQLYITDDCSGAVPTGHLGPEKADDANAAWAHAPVLQLCYQAAYSRSLSPVHRAPAASLVLLLPSHIQEAQRRQALVQWLALICAAAIQQPSAIVHLVGHSAEQRVAPSWTQCHVAWAPWYSSLALCNLSILAWEPR